MNLLRLSALAAVLVVSTMMVDAQKNYGGQSKTTKMADLETSKATTMKRGRHHKKTTKAPKAPTDAPLPSTIALEMTTSQLPPLETSSMLPAGPTSALPELSTLAPSVATTPKKRGPKKPRTPHPTLPPVDFDCKGKRDGYYSDAKDKCSYKYYACVGGLARQMSCPSSDLVFETEGRVPACVRHEESFRCSGIRPTTPAATTPRRPPPPAKLPIDCSKLSDGWYADPDNKCSHLFYSCSGGNGVRFECPGKKYFDQPSTRCMDREEVEACGGKRPTTTTPAPTTPAPITTKSPMDCSEKPSGYYPDPEKKCSQVYYACSNGDTIKRTCPGNLYFDPSTGLCEYQDENFACTGKTKPPPTTTTAPKPSPASLPVTEFNCSGMSNGGYTPSDKKCSDIFYKCIDGVTFKFTCVDQTFYDIDNDKCDRSENLFVCSGKKPTPTPTTVKPKPTEKLPIDCKGKDDGDYADPENKCSRNYYSCSGSVATRRLCPGGKTYFDKELGICDDRKNVPACTGKPRPVTPRPRPAKKPEKVPYNCSNKKDGYYEDDKKKCSSIYYACVGGDAIRRECIGDTVYDSELNQCGYRDQIPKCGGVRPTEETDI